MKHSIGLTPGTHATRYKSMIIVKIRNITLFNVILSIEMIVMNENVVYNIFYLYYYNTKFYNSMSNLIFLYYIDGFQ